jgi:hypothetical protein
MSERATRCRHEAFVTHSAREHYRVEGVLHAFLNFAGMLYGASAIFDTIGELVRRLVTEARSNA